LIRLSIYIFDHDIYNNNDSMDDIWVDDMK